jgi:hypothetical protein
MAVTRRGVHRTRWLRLQVFRYVVLFLAAVFFLVPLLSMLDFSTRTYSQPWCGSGSSCRV